MPPFVGRKRPESESPPAPPKRKRQKNEVPSSTNKTVSPIKVTKEKVQRPKSKPTVFDHVDNHKPAPTATNPVNGKLFAGVEDSDDSSVSGADSNEFEDVINTSAQPLKAGGEDEDNDEDEEDWEDALHQDDGEANELGSEDPDGMPGGELNAPIEIVLNNMEPEMSFSEFTGKKQGPSKKDRKIREAIHRLHVQTLMWHNHLRNVWINDNDVQKTMVAHLEQSQKMKIQVDTWRRKAGISDQRNGNTARKTPTKKGKAAQKASNKGFSSEDGNMPRKGRDWSDPAERLEVGKPDLSRGDPIIPLLNVLSAWWKQRFTIIAPCLRKHGYKPIRKLKEEVRAWRSGESKITDHGEQMANLKSFRSCAKKCEGSRDVGAQLFTALLRGLGVEARLVASLQPLGFGWNKLEEAIFEEETNTAAVETKESNSSTSKKGATPGTGNRKNTGKSGKSEFAAIELSDTSDLSDVDSDDSDVSIVDITPKKRPNMSYDKDMTYPTYWIEAISSATHRVFPVDPFVLKSRVAMSAEHLALFEPRGAKAERARQVLAYAVAFSPDYSAKDVTTRYLKKHVWPGKTKGFRVTPYTASVQDRHGNVVATYQIDWWKNVMMGYERPKGKRTRADEVEDEAELRPVLAEKKPVKVGDPDTLDGYKRSDKFVLERHLRREEALLPRAKSVKTFRTGKGDKAKEEDVYLRRDVVVCRTAESWHKEGRQVKLGEQPLKMVPVRAVTLNRKREIEETERQSGEKATQGMYGIEQTEWIIPPPIRDGVIPKNAYGNMDAFVPQMIPRGAVHIPLRGTKRICNKLEIDYAEAVTGFEFGNKMAVPVIEGVVVAEENHDLVVDAWHRAEEERRKREAAKREKEILGTWRKFLAGLRVLERMAAEYEIDLDGDDRKERNPFTNRKKENPAQTSRRRQETEEPAHEKMEVMDGDDGDTGGGFFPEGYHVELPDHAAARDPVFDSQKEQLDIEHDHDHDHEAPDDSAAVKEKPTSLAGLAARKPAGDVDSTPISVRHPSRIDDTPKNKKTARQSTQERDRRTSTVSGKAQSRASARKVTPAPTARKAAGRARKYAATDAKVASDDDDNDDDDDGDGLSDDDLSDTGSSHGSEAVAARAGTRTGTRASTRSAARSGQQKIRSHYFEQGGDEDDEDDGDDGSDSSDSDGDGDGDGDGKTDDGQGDGDRLGGLEDTPTSRGGQRGRGRARARARARGRARG